MNRSSKTRWSRLTASIAILGLIAAACSSGGATTAPSVGGASSAPAASVPASAAAGTVHVSIVNKDMTPAEITAAITTEAGLVVGNWTYTANDELVKQFQDYVKKTYGADIKLTYEGSQAPSVYLTSLYAAQKGGNPSPYDVMAIEENYWAEAIANDAVDSFLPSGLVPNQSMVLEQFQHVPTSIAFQSTAFPAVVYNSTRAPVHQGDQGPGRPAAQGQGHAARARRHHCRRFPAGACLRAGQGLQGSGPDEGSRRLGGRQHRTERGQVHVGLLRDAAASAIGCGRRRLVLEQPRSARVSGRSHATRPCSCPRRSTRPTATCGSRRARRTRSWPRSSSTGVCAKDVQFPNAWPIEHGPWSELSEGFLGPDYVDQVPDWFKADYAKYFPTLDQIKTNFKQVDWEAYNKGVKEWMDYYAQKTTGQ